MCWSTTPACSRGSAPTPPDGVELTFATNVLGPFLLTWLLLPALLAAAPSRVITVSSGGMYTARLDADDPQLERRSLRRRPLLRAHKARPGRAQPRLGGAPPAERIAFHAMHPAGSTPPGLRSSLPRFQRLMRPLLRDARQGADTIVWLGTEPALEPASGGFWHDRAPRPEHRLPWTRGDGRRSASASGASASASAPSRESPSSRRDLLTQRRERNTRWRDTSERSTHPTARRRCGATSPTCAPIGGVGPQRRERGARRRRAAHRGRAVRARGRASAAAASPCPTGSSRSDPPHRVVFAAETEPSSVRDEAPDRARSATAPAA